MNFFLLSNKYNKKFEEILNKKNFNTEVNNLLLLIFNHINNIYPDYKKVKVNVLDRNLIISNFLKVINEDINSIEIIKENVFDIKHESLGKTGIKPIKKQERNLEEIIVDEKNKKILTHLSPLSLYTCIIQIQPKYFYIKEEYLFKNILQDILEEGSVLNSIEILRDFKGFSWFPNYSTDFPFVKNLIYQNLIWLLGPDFMFNWQTRKINLPDYIKEIRISLIKQFDEKYANKILDSFYGSIYAYSTPSDREKLEKQIEKKKKILESTNDSEKFLIVINRKKKSLNKKIADIDLMLNNDKVLIEAFKKISEKVSDSKKISSILVYKGMVRKERKRILEKYDFLTMIQKPKNFLEYKEDLKRQINTFNKNKKLNEYIVDLQISILDAMQYKFEKGKNSKQILSYLYSLRYYKFLQLSHNLKIKDIKKLNKRIKEIEKILVTKLCELGTLQMFTYDIDINYDIISLVLNLSTLDLEDLRVELDYQPMVIGVRIYDKNNLEYEEVIKVTRKPEFKVKLRRKIKLFI